MGLGCDPDVGILKCILGSILICELRTIELELDQHCPSALHGNILQK